MDYPYNNRGNPNHLPPIIPRDDRNINPNQPFYPNQFGMHSNSRFSQPEPIRMPQTTSSQPRQPLPNPNHSNYTANNTNNQPRRDTRVNPPPGETNRKTTPPKEKDTRESTKRKREEENKKKKEENEKIEQVEKLFKRINSKSNILKRDREYLCKIKFQNRLPDPPLGPKFLQLDNDLKRFIEYKPTYLEQNFKHPILAGPTLGIPIDFVDPVTYTMPKEVLELDPGDRILIQPDFGSNRSRRNELNTAELSWLTKPQYLSSEYSELFAPSSKRENRDTVVDNSLTLEEDVRKIEETFATSEPHLLVHPTNPKMKAKRVIDVFPDFELWTNTYAHVLHDQDPLRDLDEDHEQKAFKRRNALLMPMSLSEKKGSIEYNAYIIPEDDSLSTYQWHREYFAKKISGDDMDNTMLFRFGDDSVTYKPIKMRLELNGASTTEQKDQFSRINKPSRILIDKRPPDELEKEEARNTMDTLYEPWLDISSAKAKDFSSEDFDN